MTERIILVGAGLIGAAIARRLARQGAAVAILEAGLPAGGASGASFGWINASFFANPDHFRLRRAAIEAHRALDAELGQTGTQWPGCLWWEEEGAAFDDRAETLTRLGYPIRELSRAEFAALEPAVADPPDRSLHFPLEGATDAAALTERLLEDAGRHGAQLWSGCPVQDVVLTGGRVAGVLTPQGAVFADRVILAAGTGTEALLARLGVPLPMLPRPGLILRTRAMPPVIRHILASPGQELRQDAGGHLIAPTAASHQGDSATAVTNLPGALADAALARLRALLPGETLGWDRVTLAHRPVPGDGLPAVGPVGPEGLYVATLHSGVTLAPLIADLVAEEVLDDRPAQLLSPFRPARFR